ncbi:MAG: STN domain-containing protein [Agriterribacter sp.]
MVNISEKNISLEKVFRLIKKQTGYSFLYTETQLQSFKRVSIDIKNAELEKALQVCFANQLFTYSIVEKTIVVKSITHTDVQQQGLAVEITGRVTDPAAIHSPGHLYALRAIQGVPAPPLMAASL